MLYSFKFTNILFKPAKLKFTIFTGENGENYKRIYKISQNLISLDCYLENQNVRK